MSLSLILGGLQLLSTVASAKSSGDTLGMQRDMWSDQKDEYEKALSEIPGRISNAKTNLVGNLENLEESLGNQASDIFSQVGSTFDDISKAGSGVIKKGRGLVTGAKEVVTDQALDNIKTTFTNKTNTLYENYGESFQKLMSGFGTTREQALLDMENLKNEIDTINTQLDATKGMDSWISQLTGGIIR
mgnify:CR=1 FL=1